MQPLISVLKDANIEDKSSAMIIASEVGLSDNDVLIVASILGIPCVVRSLLNKGTNVNAKGNLEHTALYEAIFNLRPEVVNILLSHPGIRVYKSDLELAKEKFIKIKKLIEDSISQGNVSKTKILEIEKEKIRQIGRMIINHLGLYTEQSRISKEGIVGVHGLPAELAAHIATFGNE